jgi:DDE family transposase
VHKRTRPKSTRHVRSNTLRSKARRAVGQSSEIGGFAAAFAQLLDGRPSPEVPRRRGRPPRVPLRSLLTALVFHVMHRVGTLGEHFALLGTDALGDSACSDRRLRLPWQVFAELMQRALRPRAQRRRHQDSFWRRWRLLAVDGTQFSLSNTPQNNAKRPKAKSRRGRAAFAKITTSVLLEVGLHNPLAAAIGHDGRSEWELTGSLLAQLPRQALLLADRLYGCAAFAAQALAACQRVGSHFLIRARSNIKARTLQRLPDGSRLIELPVRAKGSRKVVQRLTLREIRVQVRRPGHRTHELRLWTTLREPAAAPALELVDLYARRWEHELYYREVKRVLRKNELLQSHTVETAAQEIAALVLASALLARERVRAALGAVPVLRISFPKTLELLRPLWLVFALGDDLLSEEQKRQLSERFYAQAQRYITAPKRARSCPRALRQPVSGWPRLLKNHSHHGPVRFRIV